MSEDEAALVRDQAGNAGVSVSSLIRYALLDQSPLRASRKPAVNHEMAARLLGKLGQLAAALREAENVGSNDALIEAAHRDLSEMRVVLFQALGREP